MNPEIRKFWEETGCQLAEYSGAHIKYWNYAGNDMPWVAYTYVSDDKIQYIYNWVFYTEDQMLRLIKLKAFL